MSAPLRCSRFEEGLRLVLALEGGCGLHAADDGGPTCYGVTQRVYDKFRHARGFPLRPVAVMTEAEVRELYCAHYWHPARCALLPPPLWLAHFAFAVHAGVFGAALVLQRALGVARDGVLGPVTLAAAERDPWRATKAYLRAQLRFYVALCLRRPSQIVFFRGWTRRLRRVKGACRALRP